ncbi:uncharacterized protein LOC123517434 isoform X4 [Portunus trituberculatus]|uniref:uncharacterized protein LOC123517434 isoform X4 n=1 Tax=Portunus trituberculatus TaxID=210409 RepID=UPI001E1CF50B|nr:uncharacterized protein LOC123517434 isoform X4 [Portunus trituberculatus]
MGSPRIGITNEMEFADFDDDLFEEKPARDIVAKDYQARMCEAGWFMQVEPGQLVSQEDELGVQKFSAEYLFLENVPEYSHNFCKTEVPEFYEVEEKKNTRRDIMIVAACLQRAFYILVKTEGTAVGFAVTQTRTLKEKLLGDLELLLDDCSLKELRKNVHQNDKVEINLCSSESASVQENTKSRTDDEEQEVSVSQESFEEKWFGWIL